jgi:hypothetical protein
MGKAFIQESTLTDIADAIRSKNGSNDTYLPSEMADAINDIPLAIEEKDVNFYDYEGTLLYSYTKQEALALTALPPLPDRTSENLTQEGWNHTRQDVIDKLNIGFKYVCVGCTYHTTDDKTHIYHTPIDTIPSLTIYLTKNSTDSITIDWGDNNSDTMSSENGDISFTHTYSSNYFNQEIDITISNLEGKTYRLDNRIFGTNNTTISKVLCSKNLRFYVGSSTSYSRGFTSCRALKYISISQYNQNTTSYYIRYMFYLCISLKHVNIPSNFRLYTSTFYYCYSLLHFSVNKSFITGYYQFANCFQLNNNDLYINNEGETRSFAYVLNSCINIDEFVIYGTDVLYTQGDAFNSAYKLKKLVINATMSSIEPSTFVNCYNLSDIYINSDVPTLSGALTAPNTFYKIYVPRAYYNNYITASNWADIASHIYPYDFD